MFKYIVLLSAFMLASCAAWFSVTGISQLFVGASVSVGIMAVALEFSKIVGVSVLYRYNTELSVLLKRYLWTGIILLMLITSTGIYGYLSSAYASAATGIQEKQNTITLYDSQIKTTRDNIARLTARSIQLQSVRTQQENRVDELIKRSRSTTTQQRIIQLQDKEIVQLQKQIDGLTAIDDSLQLIKTSTFNSIGSSGKIGTFYYIAQTLGVSLDTIVKWFILAIVLVFDPMSIALFLSYNVIIMRKNVNIIEEVDEQNRSILTNLSDNAPPNTPQDDPRIDSDGVPDPDHTTDPPDPPNRPELDENDHIPYYRRVGYQWNPGGDWERDPQAKAWKKEVG